MEYMHIPEIIDRTYRYTCTRKNYDQCHMSDVPVSKSQTHSIPSWLPLPLPDVIGENLSINEHVMGPKKFTNVKSHFFIFHHIKQHSNIMELP